MTGNYQLVYYVAKNLGIIGILAYPKILFLADINNLFCLFSCLNIIQDLA